MPPARAAQQNAEVEPSRAAQEAAKKPEAARWRFRWDDHPSLQFGEDTRIDFRLRIQADVRASAAPLNDGPAFDIARRRVGVEGRLLGVVDFELDYEFESEQGWRDAFVNYRQFTALRVQAGKFKLPFGLEENTSATNLDFVYRARPATLLSPGRDRGAMAHGRLVDGLIRYELGWFDRDGRNARTSNPDRVFGGQTVAARLSLRPFRLSKSPLADLHLAVAFTGSDVPEGMAALRGRTALEASFFQPDYWVRGPRRRTGLEVRWRAGPFSVSAEYMRVTTDRLGQSVEDSDLLPMVAAGSYISGTWLVTGESKASGADRPRRPVHRGGPGAIEVAARLESLAFRSAATDGVPSSSPRADVILGNRDRAVTLGLNWYPLRGIKIQANLIRESLSRPELGPLPSQPAFWSRVLRFQLSI